MRFATPLFFVSVFITAFLFTFTCYSTAMAASEQQPPNIIFILTDDLGYGDLGRPDDQPHHKFLYWEFHEGDSSSQAVRMNYWKAVRVSPSAPIQLYDLRTDVAEKHDIASEHLDVVAKIRDYLKSVRTESENWPLRRNKKK